MIPPNKASWLRTALFLLSALVATSAFAKPEIQLTGNLVDPAGQLGRFRSSTAPVMIRIDHYSEESEVQHLAGVLRAKGPSKLQDELWDREVGSIRVGGGLGYPIAVASLHEQPDGSRILRLMLDRPISQREVINSSHTLDYPFGYIEVRLGADGKGQGTFYQAAKVKTVGDLFDVESYSPQPLKLLAVQER